MMSSADFPLQVVFRNATHPHPHLSRFAKGGLAHEAAAVNGAGRGGDDVVVHMNHDELNQLRKLWGEPTINPQTGCPEFFLGGLQKWFKDNEWAGAALPIAASVLAPGIGNAIGSTVGDALGASMSPAMTNALGNGLLGAGVGALTGGGKGALIGGLAGGLGGYLTTGDMPDMAHGGVGPDVPKGFKTPDGQSVSSGGALSNLFGGGDSSGSGGLLGGSLGKALPLIAIAGMMGSHGSSQKASTDTTNQQQQAAIAKQNAPLSQVSIPRQQVTPAGDPRTAGYRGQDTYFTNNYLPATYAHGGSVGGALPGPGRGVGPAPAQPSQGSQPYHAPPGPPSHHFVQGPGDGRADKIPAALSDGEYVMDAETTAMLGNGSSKAGAAALDQLRANIRKHKGGALAHGKISPNAKPAHAYLPKGALP